MRPKQTSSIDLKTVHNIEIEGIDTSDYPDFCDAFISYAEIGPYEATEDQLEELNENGSFVHEQVWKKLY